jgi:hypothetical protein
MLPANLLSSTSLAQMRAFATSVMIEPVTVVSVTVGYDIVYTLSGYVGKPSGTDLELLRETEYIGERTNDTILVLLPYGNPILESYVIHTQDSAWRVINSNHALQNGIKINERAICQRVTIEDSKLWRTS